MRVGLLGSRSDTMLSVFKEKGLHCELISHYSEINNTYDIVFGSGVYDLVSEKYLELPTYGIVFFHETPLPEGKGNAPLQWTVENKKLNITVTAFKAVKAIDAGAIICQFNVPIYKTDTLSVLEIKRRQGIQGCLKIILEEMDSGYLLMRDQSGRDSYNPKRTIDDSELDCNKPLIELWDKIRVCDNEKFPAFFRINNKKIILKYEVEN